MNTEFYTSDSPAGQSPYAGDLAEPTRRRRPRPWQGILFFAAVMLTMVFVAAPIQYFLGMWGVALTELILLLLALGASALLFRSQMAEVFPIRRPSLPCVFGTILTWLGIYLLVILSTLILAYFFPQGFADVSNNMGSILASTPFPVTFFIVALMPAVCEEAVHRGFIQYTFRDVRIPAVTVLCIAVIFGLFHMDPCRFLPTALLGAGLAFVMQRTGNMLYPALFHFINNAFSVIVSGVSYDSASLPEVSPDLLSGPLILTSIGIFLMTAAAAPFCLLCAGLLLRKPEAPRKSLLAPILTASILSGAMLIIGFALLIGSILLNPDAMGLTQEMDTIENLLTAFIPQTFF